MQPLMYLVPVVLIGGYYAYFYLGGGKDRFQKMYRKKFGLRDGEQVHAIYTGYFAFEDTVGNQAMSLIGVGKRGANFMMALTSHGRLLIGHNEAGDPPMSFDEGEVQVIGSPTKPNYGKLANSAGKMEKAQVVQLVTARGNLHIEVAQSTVTAVTTWSTGGGVPPLTVV